MKRTLQAFSLGLLVTGLIMVTTSLFTSDSSASQNVNDMEIDEMIDIMKEQGYRVVSESEYISLSLSDSEKEDKSDDEKAETDDPEDTKSKETEDDKQENKVITYKLHIKDGMPSSEIGNLLEENDVVDDGDEFNKFLEDEDYSTKVQPGKFKVDSDMSFKEIAKTFTR